MSGISFRDETGRARGATLAAGGRRAEAGGDASRGREMARPVSLPLELGPVKCWSTSSNGW